MFEAIWNFITGLFGAVGTAIEYIKGFCIAFYNIAVELIKLIPSPFQQILLMGLVVTISIIVVKLIRS